MCPSWFEIAVQAVFQAKAANEKLVAAHNA
jgi:hypothetical protein